MTSIPTVTTTTSSTTTTLRAGRKRRHSSSADKGLSWEKFDFGESPKWDDRFANSRSVVASNEQELQAVYQTETQADEQLAHNLKQQAAGWQALHPDVVQRATALLRPYVRDERYQRLTTVLSQRTQHVRFLFENPVNPSNVWACLRTLDAFGIQHVDVVLQSARYQGQAAVAHKRGLRTAMGSAQWLTLRNHASTTDAVQWLRRHHPPPPHDDNDPQHKEGRLQIWASDLSDRSKDIRQLDWVALAAQGPICIVMGNEERGISDEMRQSVDGTFYLPMAGFAESFNLSVATAISAAHLSAASGVDDDGVPQGPFRPGDLSAHEYNCLILKGLLNSVAQKRMAYALLRKEGIELPEDAIKLL